MVVVFDDQLTNLPANRAHRQRPGSNGRVHAGSARSPAEAGRGHAYHDPFAPQRRRGDNAGGRGTGTQPHPGRQGGRPRRNHHHRGRQRRPRRRWPPPGCGSRPSRQRAADGQRLCNTSPGKPLVEPEALTSIHDASNNPNDPNEASAIATGQGVIIGNVDADTLAGNPNMIRPNGQHVIIDAPDPTENVFSDEFNGDVSTIAAQGTVTYTYASQLPFSNFPANCSFRIVGDATGASHSHHRFLHRHQLAGSDRGSRVAGHRRAAAGGERGCQRRVGVLRLRRSAGCQRRPARADERRHGGKRALSSSRARATAARPARSRPPPMTPTSSTPAGRTTSGSSPRPMATPRAGKTTT